jgi:hypothetical protein
LEKLLRQRAELTGLSTDFEILQPMQSNGKLGFGGRYAELYGLGKGYHMDLEESAENDRFQNTVKSELLPAVIRDRKGGKQWETGKANPKAILKRAKSSKLVYSGFSY